MGLQKFPRQKRNKLKQSLRKIATTATDEFMPSSEELEKHLSEQNKIARKSNKILQKNQEIDLTAALNVDSSDTSISSLSNLLPEEQEEFAVLSHLQDFQKSCEKHKQNRI